MKQRYTKVLVAIAALMLSFGVPAKGPTVLLKDANGISVGRVIGMDNLSAPYVLTDEGYHAIVSLGSGKVVSRITVVYFSEPFCQGEAYVEDESYLGVVYTLASGAHYTFYTPSDALQRNVLVSSTTLWDPWDPPLDAEQMNGLVSSSTITECYNIGPWYVDVWPAYRNDPEVTGIANEAYPTRMLLE